MRSAGRESGWDAGGEGLREHPALHYIPRVAHSDVKQDALGRSGVGRSMLVVGVVLLGALILLVRRHEALTTAFLWAEDGAVFVQQQLAPGADLLVPYNGQLWLIQRLLLTVADLGPLAQLPLTLLLGSLALTLGSMAVVLQYRLGPLFGGLRYQVLAFVLLLLLPGAWESLGTTLSLHWWLVLGAAAICLTPPARHRWGTALEVVWLTIVGLSGLVSWIVLPIAIGALVVRRSSTTALRAGVILATAAVQALVLLTSTRAIGEPAGLVDLARITALRIGGVAVMGEQWLSDAANGSTSLAILAIGAAFLLLAVVVAVVGRPWPGIVLMLAAAVSTAIGLWGADEPLALLTPPQGGRYFIPALSFIVLALVLSLTSPTRWSRMLSGLGLIVMAFAFVTNTVIASPEPALDEKAWRDFAICVESGEGDASDSSCTVDIAPTGWRVAFP